MKTIKKCVYILAVLVLFTGCTTSNYSVKPEYDAKTLTLKVDSLNFEKVTKKQDNTFFSHQSANMTSNRVVYDTGDEACNNFIFVQMDANVHWYLFDNISNYLYTQYVKDGSGECKVTEVSNLKFFECDPKNGFTNFGTRLRQSERYWVVSYSSFSQKQYNGYSRIDALNLGNKKCYAKFYDLLTSKAVSEGFRLNSFPLLGSKDF